MACKRFGLMVGLMAAATVLLAAPAWAHHRDDHSRGPHQAQAGSSGQEASSSETVVTEDDDFDGQPNMPDPRGDTDNAHPSGRDRSFEAGGSGNQGKAVADPDDDGRGPDRTNGGVDQPRTISNGGGVDVLDQDGNNGCGNDDDFEDDNEGRCGGNRRGGGGGGGGAGGGGGGGGGGDGGVTPTVVNPPTVGEDGVVTAAGNPGQPAGPGGPVLGPAPQVDAPDEGLAFTGFDALHLVDLMLVMALLGFGFVYAGIRFERA